MTRYPGTAEPVVPELWVDQDFWHMFVMAVRVRIEAQAIETGELNEDYR